MILCPRCGSPCTLRPGHRATPPLISVWESELCITIAGLVDEWRCRQNEGTLPRDVSIKFWTAMENLCQMYESLKAAD
jgi:hypothetical protein